MRLLGTIAAPNSASTTNASTATPFTMPQNPCMLLYEPSGSGLKLKHGAVATATDFALGSNAWQVPWAGRDTGLIALRNDSGGALSCNVYATDLAVPVSKLS